MKLLVVGHTYLTAFAQSKYAAMKMEHPDLQLRLVIPPRMPHPFKVFTAERHPAFSVTEVVVIPTVCGRDHMSYVLNPWRLYQALRTFRPDHIHVEEDPHSLVGFETALVARFAAPCATLSYFIWDNLARIPRFPLNLIKSVLTRLSLSRASLVVCGNSEAEYLLREVKGFRGRTAVLPQLGIDEGDYVRAVDANALARFQGQGPWIGFLGRLVPEKGVVHLLEALAALPDVSWRVLIVGSGPLRDEIEGRWRSVFGERMRCFDAVTHAEVPDLLRGLDVFVLPSYAIEGWKEQFGLTLAQAMLAGVACVGTQSGAIPEVLGGTGVIVPERDVPALAAALRELCTSGERRQSLGAAAQARARAHFLMPIVAEHHFQLFLALRNSKPTAVSL